MPSKMQAYQKMSQLAQQELTASLEGWQSFLTTSARLYKYPYHDQVMIHAQRPDATACAEFGVWNNQMNRFIRRGSRGIALLDTTGSWPKLRYVFDVSDTGERPNSRNPNLWELRDEHLNFVSAALQQSYDISPGDSLPQQLSTIAYLLAEEYWEDNKQDILHILDNSFLSEYDEFNTGAAFKNAVEVSCTYALLSRCGFEPSRHFEPEDFMSVFDFNTPEAAGALGTAVSGINQKVLREIGAIIRNYGREKNTETTAFARKRKSCCSFFILIFQYQTRGPPAGSGNSLFNFQIFGGTQYVL